MKRKFICILVLGFLLMGCNAESDGNVKDNDTPNPVNEVENNKNEEPVSEGIAEPVTIKFGVNLEEKDFERIYKNPIEDQFPNATLELVTFAPNRELIEDQFLVGNVPDIILGNNLEQLYLFDEYDLLTDLTEIIEAKNYDLSLFNSSFIEAIRSFAGGEALWALPKDMTRYGLHYNKEIFDLFGVDYPEDGMSWQEIIDLSKLVSGERNNETYVGLHLPVPRILLSTLSTPLVDPDTDKPLFTEEPEFTELFKLYEQVYIDQDQEPNLEAIGPFVGEQNLAMVPIYYLYTGWTGLQSASEEGMDWDLVTFPSWDKDDLRTPMVGGQWMAVSDFSEHKHEALEVIKFLLGPEMISTITETPVSVPFNSEAMVEIIDNTEFDEVIDEKNIEALFKNPTLDKEANRSKYESLIYNVLVEKVNEFILQEEGAPSDVNTALRELQEAAEGVIEEEKGRE